MDGGHQCSSAAAGSENKVAHGFHTPCLQTPSLAKCICRQGPCSRNKQPWSDLAETSTAHMRFHEGSLRHLHLAHACHQHVQNILPPHGGFVKIQRSSACLVNLSRSTGSTGTSASLACTPRRSCQWTLDSFSSHIGALGTHYLFLRLHE